MLDRECERLTCRPEGGVASFSLEIVHAANRSAGRARALVDAWRNVLANGGRNEDVGKSPLSCSSIEGSLDGSFDYKLRSLRDTVVSNKTRLHFFLQQFLVVPARLVAVEIWESEFDQDRADVRVLELDGARRPSVEQGLQEPVVRRLIVALRDFVWVN